ncbi:hypothetical protein ACF07S_02965 [Streptomyces sp. NPDC016640]|uniref:hypothetical protein n=1 Tax=Streptomyces sp. NPDC016640 TaxID=3364969 RepID=UPI0036F6E1FD
MSITARLRDSVRLPGGGALVNGFAFESRGDGPCRALLRDGQELEAYDLHEVFAGERAPAVVFPHPWPGWNHGVHSVSPDGTFAVCSGQCAVRAVGTGGETLWEYRHGCWGPEPGHAHTGDEQEVCRGPEHGSCRISDDGRLVWAHVVAEPEPGGDEDETCWDYACGFVDADTVIASTADSDEDRDRARHWLLDARTLRIRGVVAYPAGPDDSYVRPLGDGTWLTYDDGSETLSRWAGAAPARDGTR